MYSIVTSENWKVLLGAKSGISQNAAHNGPDLSWNFPFNISLEAKTPSGWPQIMLVLYGKDFMGRSIVKGYGNIHLPVSAGTHTRDIHIFNSLPQSNTATFCAMLMGYMHELKNP